MRRSENPCPLSLVEVLEKRCLLSVSPAAAQTLVPGDSSAVVAQAAATVSLQKSLLANLSSVTPVTASTVPDNGDVNPYGAVFVPEKFPSGGAIQPGDLLVSNFNNSSGLQGTGTTIVRVAPDGTTSTFFQGADGLGLTTALGTLKKGFVIVGNMPTTDGTSDTVQPGSLIVLDKNGNEVSSFTDPSLNGPWDLTIKDNGSSASVFVSNVLSGTVSRIDVKVSGTGVTVKKVTQIASGFAHTTDPDALVLGPTGLVLAGSTLYVASTADNAIYAIKNATGRKTDAGIGKVIYRDSTHLHGPLALVMAPNGHLIASNGDAVNADPAHPSALTEFTKKGKFVSEFQVDPEPGGAFGLAVMKDHSQTFFAAVDDVTNTVSIWKLGKSSSSSTTV